MTLSLPDAVEALLDGWGTGDIVWGHSPDVAALRASLASHRAAEVAPPTPAPLLGEVDAMVNGMLLGVLERIRDTANEAYFGRAGERETLAVLNQIAHAAILKATEAAAIAALADNKEASRG